MNLKKLTQAVFQGLPVEYQWAGVQASGFAFVSKRKPIISEVCDFLRFCDPHSLSADFKVLSIQMDATDWQNSLIERQDVPTAADIDWSKAPEGATHYNTSSGAFFKRLDSGLVLVSSETAGEWASLGAYTVFDLESSTCTIKRPESIHDVARSIEAARAAEKSERTYPHYFKDVSDVDAIDLYHVARLYDITDPALFHAFKKIACAGKRGSKDQAQDVQEAIDALKRWQELNV